MSSPNAGYAERRQFQVDRHVTRKRFDKHLRTARKVSFIVTEAHQNFPPGGVGLDLRDPDDHSF
jgi:hypothetical protein